MTTDPIAAARALIEPLTGYTPGPWSYGGSVEQVWGGVIESCGHHVASAHGENDDECKANARLMAAAPVMRDTIAALLERIRAQAQREAETSRRANKLLADWDAWEGDIILRGDWSAGTVRLTQDQHDRMQVLQEERNALRAAIGEDKS